jgi:hypothetical protein
MVTLAEGKDMDEKREDTAEEKSARQRASERAKAMRGRLAEGNFQIATTASRVENLSFLSGKKRGKKLGETTAWRRYAAAREKYKAAERELLAAERAVKAEMGISKSKK